MDPFFITGLPRTRSAWLANLFCTDTTVCWHEPREPITELIERNPGVRVGVAGSIYTFHFTALAQKYPDAPWLYVDRDPSEAMRSFMKFTRDHYRLLGRDVRRIWELHAVQSRIVKAHPRTLTVDYNQLSDPAVIGMAWYHIMPGGQPLNHARLAVLDDLQIEQRLVNRLKDSKALTERLHAA